MTPLEFANKMKEILLRKDPESEHDKADDLMCEVLTSLGYKDGVKAFRESTRWYA